MEVLAEERETEFDGENIFRFSVAQNRYKL
jgi:hypothetical protein